MHEQNQDNKDQQNISVNLAAYVLGELDAVETAEVEAALERSAELRAERVQLESVIGLVREHGAEQAILSEETRAALLARAEAGGGTVLSFFDRPLSQRMATAASVMLLVGMAGAIYWMGERSSNGEAKDMQLAWGYPEKASVRRESAQEERLDRNASPPLAILSSATLPTESARTKKPQAQDEAPVFLGEQRAGQGNSDSKLQKQLPVAGGGGSAARMKGKKGDAGLVVGEKFGFNPADPAQSAKSSGGPGTPGPTTPGPARKNAPSRISGRGSYSGPDVKLAFGGRAIAVENSPLSITGSGEFYYLREAQGRTVPGDRLREIGYLGVDAVDKEARITGGVISQLDEIEEVEEDGADDFFLDHGSEADRAERRRRQVDEWSKSLIDSCRPFPHEEPAAMFFRFWGDNPFVHSSLDAQSTFGVDVDTASYTLARRYLRDGNLPEKAQIRTEEFLNYFKPDVAAPTEGTFRVQTELAPSRFGGPNDKWMLRITVRGKDVARDERQPLNLTFVVDVSGSMKQNGRLETVKHGLRLLTAQLDANDSIALVAYSNEARIILPMTSAGSRALIEEAIHGLQPGGGTNAEAGLKMGYAAAADQISTGRHHRVVLLSDGVANIGETDQDRINADIKKYRDLGIYLNTIGVGMDNHNDTFLEQLANKGDGICNYIDDEKEARRALVENFTGAFEPIARDVKIQVQFEAGVVRRYRQIGYENRAIADADFRNDAVDAGEVGAGHQVTALYELELEPNAASVKAALATVRLRWKEPTGAGRDPQEDAATESGWTTSLNGAASWEGASYGFRRAVCVAQFAELLRRSEHARTDTLEDLIAEAQRIEREHLAGSPGKDDDFVEFIGLLERSREVILNRLHKPTPLEDCVRRLKEQRYRHHSCITLQEGPEVVGRLQAEISVLEAKVRELVEQESL